MVAEAQERKKEAHGSRMKNLSIISNNIVHGTASTIRHLLILRYAIIVEYNTSGQEEVFACVTLTMT